MIVINSPLCRINHIFSPTTSVVACKVSTIQSWPFFFRVIHAAQVPIKLMMYSVSTFLQNSLTVTYGFCVFQIHPKLRSKLLLIIGVQFCTFLTSLNPQFSSFRKNHDKTRKPFSSRIIQLQTHFPSSLLIRITWNLYPIWRELNEESKTSTIIYFQVTQKNIQTKLSIRT
jgi:hypothetical protein